MEGATLSLISLVLNALHGLLSFYGRDYSLLNVDGVFGLRVIEGQLKRIYDSKYREIPLELSRELKSMSLNASKLANMALPHVFEDDPEYFKQFKYLLHRPWFVSKEHRLTDARFVWPAHVRTQKACLNEQESDECMTQLMDAAASVAEGWGREDAARKLDAVGCNLITVPCLQRMLKKKGCYGYSLTHQLLYVAVAEQVDCAVVVDEYAKKIGYAGGAANIVTEFCSNLLHDMQALISPSNAEDISRGQPNVDIDHQDLFMEIQFVCAQFGFVEFIRRDWLEAMLTWQDKTGCYSNKDPSSPAHLDAVGRKLLMEKDLADDCASHKSAVAAAALTVYLRFLIDPGGGEFRRLRIDRQPAAYSSIPLAGRFWKMPSHWRFESWEHDFIGPLPDESEYRDSTLIWFLAAALCFLYVSYRLCRRKSLRYARWRGLKWR